MAKTSALAGLKSSMETEAAGTAPDSAGRTSEPQRSRRGRPPAGEASTDVRSDRKGITVFYPLEVRKALKDLANEEDSTVQALVGEGIDMVMRSRGRHPFGAR